MTDATFIVNKANVYNEVAKTTSYSGIKGVGTVAYDTVFTTDADREMLERFWNEACNTLTNLFHEFLVSVTDSPESHGTELGRNYVAELALSSSYDITLTPSVQSSMFSFVTNYIVAKWLAFINRTEAQSYAAEAGAMLDDIKGKIYFKKRPVRISPTNH